MLTPLVLMLARKTLMDTNAALIEIAEKVGYQSEAAFSRVFKKQFGVAPIAYRKLKEVICPFVKLTSRKTSS
ncbi:MAG: AraC family transcriptional activator of mtrCDE [Saprospiraceae bacterium]|jgi:AraC family transcriptional activator of mtrCDE